VDILVKGIKHGLLSPLESTCTTRAIIPWIIPSELIALYTLAFKNPVPIIYLLS